MTIFSIITVAGIVAATMPWPDNTMVECNQAVQDLLDKNKTKVETRKVKAWCAKYPSRPALGILLNP